MADSLPKSGVQLVVENAKQAIGDLNAFQKALGQQNKALATVAKSSTNTSRFMSAFNKDLGNIAQNALRAVPGLGKFSSLLTSVGSSGVTAAAGTSALGASMAAALPVIGAVVVSVAAATAGLYAFWQVGVRGAQLQPVIDAFGNLAGQFGDSNEILQRLRDQTKGTISDMNLMRIATFALSGTSQELGTIFAENLGKNLNDISRLATAIGRDPVEAQNRWIDALKKGERELLDELGIVVSANQAYEVYAKGINKSVAELTAYDKQAAFAQEATRQLNEAVAKLPDQSGILVTLQRIPVAIQNIMDRLALVIQPLFAPIVEAVGAMITRIEAGANNLILILNPIMKVLGVIFTEVLKTVQVAWESLMGDFDRATGGTMPYVIATIQIFSEALAGIAQIVFPVVRAAIQAFGSFLNGLVNVFKTIIMAVAEFFGGVGKVAGSNLNQLAFMMGKGGAQIIGAFAAGIIRGGTYVLQAVTQIAQIVADFLMGFSPPKRGVLHNIDKGAENVATSWVDGFLGGIQKSFDEVLGYVNDRLGEIASLSRDQIETRLAQLDIALRPFKENLAIVKADMEAIAGFTDPAMKIMERQRTALLKAFGRGDSSLDVERLRTQDRQIQRLKELKELGQDQVDQAELQLALANSQQAQERALLGIALDRMGAEKQIADTSEKVAKEAKGAAEKAPGGGGGGAAKPGGAGANLPFGQGEKPDLFGSEEVDRARAEILAAISGAVSKGADILSDIPGIAGSAAAGAQAGLAGSGFSDALAGFNAQKGALGGQLGRIQEADPAQKIADKFAGLKDKLTQPIKDVREFFNTEFEGIFGEEGTVTVLLNSFRDNILKIFTGDDSVFTLAQSMVTIAIDTIVGKFSELKDSASLQLQQVRTFFETTFINADSTLGQVWTKIQEIINNIIGDQGFMRLVNDGEGTLKGALSTLGEALTNAVILPAKTAMEALVNIVIGALNGMIREINKIPTVNIHEITPFQIDIGDIIGHARGTLGDFNPFMAGERGRELVVPSRNNPLSVFPNKATMALDRIGGLMQRMGGVTAAPPKPQPMSIYLPPQASSQNTNNNTHNNNSNNRNVTINPRQSMTTLEMRRMMAGM